MMNICKMCKYFGGYGHQFVCCYHPKFTDMDPVYGDTYSIMKCADHNRFGQCDLYEKRNPLFARIMEGLGYGNE